MVLALCLNNHILCVANIQHLFKFDNENEDILCSQGGNADKKGQSHDALPFLLCL